jgi:2-polyprenyl-3-methyl-5-hydroxy-6-metoxy-1,4-benzoquinol methylase
MAGRVCPWWVGYLIDNPLRPLLHNPQKILGPYVKPGMTVMDVGCGMGIFSIAMAKLVGDHGRVIAVDLQQRMLDVMKRRAEKAGVGHRIAPHRCEAGHLGVDTKVDFVLAFAMVHEVPNTKEFLRQICTCLKAGGKFLVAEPRLHVPLDAFQKMLETGDSVGLRAVEQPEIWRCRAVVFAKVDAIQEAACQLPVTR